MSQYTQQAGINSGRAHLDDQYDGKLIFQFNQLQGNVDGTNLLFQVPELRLVVRPTDSPALVPQAYINGAPLTFATDYSSPNPKQGLILYISGKQPKPGDTQTVTFNFTWFDDIELDRHLNKGANECGFPVYYTTSSNIAGVDGLPAGATLPTDIPDGLFNAMTLLGASYAARALALRFGNKYDFSVGDHSFSPSQMAKAYTDLAKDLEKRGLNARDDFYKSQGRQYKPATDQQGFILPNWTPAR